MCEGEGVLPSQLKGELFKSVVPCKIGERGVVDHKTSSLSIGQEIPDLPVQRVNPVQQNGKVDCNLQGVVWQ